MASPVVVYFAGIGTVVAALSIGFGSAIMLTSTTPVQKVPPAAFAKREQPVEPQAPAPVAFKAVIQHDDSEGEAHRPQRRRRSASDEANQPQALQIVETQAEVAPPLEDDLPRRTKPRRRHSGTAEAEPLKLVETQPNTDTQRPENPPTP